ncbi:hypothetical protein HPB52_000124 [Rhipicephalus sanguineus]|uniref:THAP-type domain-containing protein n=1 Tax=Rhipicephalus sanguineus TaxID=34632 RepID=A0A9D4T0M5_RHISA|nr:hypothetical protein HPB52_000124 [Rhipicephalus sanguineus]
MRNVCSVEGCINGPRRLIKGSGSVDPSVSSHAVPRDEPRRSRWLNAVPMIRRQKELKKPVVCSLHFSPSDYVYNPVLGKALGVPQKGLLTRSAVPSLLAPSFPPQVPSQEQTSVSAAIAESAIEGDAAGVPVETQTGDGVAETERSQDEENTAPVGGDKEVDDSYRGSAEDVGAGCHREIHSEASVLPAAVSTSGLQGQKDPARCPPSGTTGRSIGIDKSVQVHVRGISVGVQVNLAIKEKKDEGVQVDIDDVPLTSTPVKRQQQISPETSYVASPNLSPVRTCVDTTGSTYQPDESSWTLDSTLDEDDE